MDIDRKISMAIASGERNKQVMELIRNWCRHARVEKLGGVGMVEAQTGLPIGLHSVACSYSAARSLARWDLADAALDFHDRNCVGCAYRDPIGFPNLSTLVSERDATRVKEARKRQRCEEALEARRTVRKERRSALQAILPSRAADIVGYIDELDGPNPGEAAERLLHAAKLAPETFEPAVIEHMFELMEDGESRFYEIGLQVLRELNVDPTRLTRCAMRALAAPFPVDKAAEIVELHAPLVDHTQIAAALPALIELADLRPNAMSIPAEILIPKPGPFVSLYRAHPQAVELGLQGLLAHSEPDYVSAGARGIACLAGIEPSLPCRFAHFLIARLVRSKDSIQPETHAPVEKEWPMADLRAALALAFHVEPDRTDTLAQQFLATAPGEDELEIHKVYELALRGRCRGDPKITADEVDRTILRRLLSRANQTNSYDVLQVLHGAFTYASERLVALGREELTLILGTALMLSQKIHTAEGLTEPRANPASPLERINARDQRIALLDALIDWAASAAAGDPSATAEYIAVLTNVPDEDEELRAKLIGQAHRLMRTPHGLNATLPTVYRALFASSGRVRAAVAAAIGQLDRKTKDDLPKLVYEALVAQLADPCAMAHQSAVHAIERTDLPENLKDEARRAILNLVETYHKRRRDERVLVDCICLYMDRYATDAERDELIDTFLKIVDELKADHIVGKLWRLAAHFCHESRFADVVVRVVEEDRAVPHWEDELVETLNGLPEHEIYRHRARLEKVGSQPNVSWTLSRRLIETLTRAGAWPEAARLAKTLYTRIPATVENRARKLAINRWRIAARFEAAIAAGELENIAQLSQEWRQNEKDIEADRVAHEQRRRPFPGVPGTH